MRKKEVKPGILSPKGMGVLLLRLLLGALFLAAGTGRLTGTAGFAGTVQPGTLAAVCVHALSFAEFAVGILLVLGFCTRWAFLAGALLVAPLTVGMMVWQDNTIVATGVACLFMATAGVWLAARWNPLSLDLLIEQTSDRLFNMK